MPNMTPIQQLNRDLAHKLTEEAKQDPQSPYTGKKVGIANGRIVVVSEDWDDVGEQLRQAEPDPAKRCCVDIGGDYSGVHEIWSVR
jgi:hypothetical protein